MQILSSKIKLIIIIGYFFLLTITKKKQKYNISFKKSI